MRLAINNLIRFIKEEGDSSIERILYISPRCEDIALINVDNTVADPTWRKYSDIIEDLKMCDAIILDIDSHLPPAISSDELHAPKYKDIRKRAERDWSLIRPLLTGENALKMLFKHERGVLLRQRAEELISDQEHKVGISTKSLLRKVRRFWQRGQTPHALLSDYKNCGGSGKPRKAGQLKRGAPSKIARAEHRPTGVNIDDKWQRIIVKGCNAFYLNRAKKDFHYAYVNTLRLFCSKGIDKDTGKPILPDPNNNEVFTENQFKYHCQKYIRDNLGQALIKRQGQRRFELNYRGLKGDSTSQAPWPGALYQIDATVADVYLVSSLNRKQILKRPVIWLVSDVFSRMIVGICIRFEGEGWLGLKLALENTTTDKAAYCLKYGIKISEELWPASSLPDHLTGDRGPLLSHNADSLPYYLNIEVSNTPPYRPDWKAIIEQVFNQMNIRVIHGLPGAVDPDHERGDKDYRLAAVLTIHELTEIIISTVLYYNNHHRMESYPLDREMISDGVQPYPSELYFWGIDNRSGSPRFRDSERVRLALLPEGKATVTPQGIKFGPNLYQCEYAEKHGWRLKARNYGSWKVRVGFDSRCADVIYLRQDETNEALACYIDSNSPFKNCDWAEIDTYTNERRVASAHATHRGIQALSDLESDVGDIVSRASEKTRAALVNGEQESGSSRLKNMKGKTKEEIGHMHRVEAAHISSGGSNTLPTGVASEATEPSIDSDDTYVPIPEPTNIRDVRERMLRDGKSKG
jgi:putative transposase